jgi:hypothetical protein
MSRTPPVYNSGLNRCYSLSSLLVKSTVFTRILGSLRLLRTVMDPIEGFRPRFAFARPAALMPRRKWRVSEAPRTENVSVRCLRGHVTSVRGQYSSNRACGSGLRRSATRRSRRLYHTRFLGQDASESTKGTWSHTLRYPGMERGGARRAGWACEDRTNLVQNRFNQRHLPRMRAPALSQSAYTSPRQGA